LRLAEVVLQVVVQVKIAQVTHRLKQQTRKVRLAVKV
jgi:hypothetical protein